MGSHLAEVFDIAVANSLSVLILIGLTFFVRQFEYSRLVFLYFWVLNLVALSFSRMVFREGLRFFRKQGLQPAALSDHWGRQTRTEDCPLTVASSRIRCEGPRLFDSPAAKVGPNL